MRGYNRAFSPMIKQARHPSNWHNFDVVSELTNAPAPINSNAEVKTLYGIHSVVAIKLGQIEIGVKQRHLAQWGR